MGTNREQVPLVSGTGDSPDRIPAAIMRQGTPSGEGVAILFTFCRDLCLTDETEALDEVSD